MSQAAILQSSPSRVLVRQQLKAEFGLPFSNPTLLRMERAGTFPKRFHLSSKCPAWLERDVIAWIEARRLDTDSPRTHTDRATAARQAKRHGRVTP